MNYWQQVLALVAVDLTSIVTTGGWIFVHVAEQEIIGPRPRHRRRTNSGYLLHMLLNYRFFQRLVGALQDADLIEIQEIESEPNIGQGNGHAHFLEGLFLGEIPTQTDWWQDDDGPGQPLEGPRD